MKIDTITQDFLLSHHNHFLDSFFKVVTFFGDIVFVLPLFIIVTIFLFYKSKKFILPLWASFFVANTITFILKHLIMRARPIGGLIVETGFSFPSGHATVAFCFYGFLSFIFYNYFKSKGQDILAQIAIYKTCIIILLISISRLYLGVHFLTDVIAGMIVGSFGLFIGIYIYRNSNFINKF